MINQLIEDTVFWDIVSRIIVSAVLLAILIGLSYWQRIELEKIFLFSFIRGLIQIVLMAFILVIIFELRNIVVLFSVLLLMCYFAAYTAKQRYHYGTINIFKIEMIAITVGGLSIMLMVTLIGIIPAEGVYIIPMGGMVISNTMVITNIAIERIYSDIKKSRGTIEAALSLGDSPRNAVFPIIKTGFRAGLLPSTNRVAILGIVTIPGLMSGMIIGGINPIVAAVYQIIIFLMLLSGGFIGEIIASYFFMKELFTKEDQLKLYQFIKNNKSK